MKKMSFFAGFITILCLCLTSNTSAIEADGWASQNGGTTGGQGGPTVTVYDEPNLFKYATDMTPGPYIVQVSGTIHLGGSGDFEISSNKTIRGVGINPTLIGGVGFKNRDGNIIIERLNITNPCSGSSCDGISLAQDIYNVLVTKCTIYDGGDGLFDITNNSDFVTVSWCKFYYNNPAPSEDHRFACLVGSSDTQEDDAANLRVTYHHNWWANRVKERMPRVRYGQVHVYNNYYGNLDPTEGYCVGVGCGSRIRVENNYFNTVHNPWKDYYTGTGHPAGHIGWNTGNIFYDCIVPTWAANEYDTIFTPPYAYTLDNAEDIPALVQYGAGANGQDGFTPHWFFSYYGDFDKSGFVDMNDFAEFANYWKADVNDCNQLWDADYNGDCEVDFYEMSLLAEHWLYIAPDITPPAVPTGLTASGDDAIVSLDWDDNTEEDLAGYNIYRSTTSGSGYSKLNSSLFTDSNYIDSNVVNETAYYYVVTATDTNSNESDYSIEVSAMPSTGTSDLTIQENAPGFCGLEGVIDNSHAGYTGDGFCDTENAVGKGINWSVNILTAGNYTFTWRYAHGKTDDRSGKLLINGSEVVSSIAFPATGAFTTWSTTSTSEITLTEGVKTLRLQATTGDGLANIDYITIAGESLMPAGCP